MPEFIISAISSSTLNTTVTNSIDNKIGKIEMHFNIKSDDAGPYTLIASLIGNKNNFKKSQSYLIRKEAGNEDLTFIFSDLQADTYLFSLASEESTVKICDHAGNPFLPLQLAGTVNVETDFDIEIKCADISICSGDEGILIFKFNSKYKDNFTLQKFTNDNSSIDGVEFQSIDATGTKIGKVFNAIPCVLDSTAAGVMVSKLKRGNYFIYVTQGPTQSYNAYGCAECHIHEHPRPTVSFVIKPESFFDLGSGQATITVAPFDFKIVQWNLIFKDMIILNGSGALPDIFENLIAGNYIIFYYDQWMHEYKASFIIKKEFPHYNQLTCLWEEG